MKVFLNTILIAFFLSCFTKNILAQDSLRTDKVKHNFIKTGRSLTATKFFLSYEHAFKKHISLGGMASTGGLLFIGYSGTLFSRYYFSKFNKSGWFIEASGSYSYFNPIVYNHYYQTPYENTYITHYQGQHTATISYLSAGLTAGYKFVYSKHFFLEFLAGLHYGIATFGKDDLYIDRSNIALSFGASDVVKTVFKNSGPGFPFHFMINFGFAF